MDTQTHTVRKKLIEVAKRKGTVLYSEVAPIVNLQAHDFTLFQILDDINRHEHGAGRPLLTAVVVSKEDRMPGGGFFKLATQLGHHREGDDRTLYWAWELKQVYAEWASD